MLTPPQDKLHWSEFRNARGDIGWGGVVIANGWQARGLGPEVLEEQKSRSTWHQQTIAFAETLSRLDHGPVAAGHLRKGAYWLALGKPKSHTAFNNADLDRVLNVFRLLVDPEDLQAVMEWNDNLAGNPPGERRRMVYFIKGQPGSYLHAILRDENSYFQLEPPEHRGWENLPLEKLHNLVRTLKNRHAVFHGRGARGAGRETELVKGPW